MKIQEKQQEGKYSEVLKFVTRKRFALANLGITDKMSFDWRKAGVYLQDKKTKYRMKYSPIEYIWLLLVKESREFGLPIKSVINLKDFLMNDINVESLLLAIQDSVADSKLVLLQKVSEEQDSIREGVKKEVEGLEDHIVNSMFTSMIISTLLGEKEYVLFIKKDGSCLIETIGDDDLSFSGFLSESCLMVPFRNMVNSFIEKEEIHRTDSKKKLKKSEGKISETFDFKFLKNITEKNS